MDAKPTSTRPPDAENDIYVNKRPDVNDIFHVTGAVRWKDEADINGYVLYSGECEDVLGEDSAGVRIGSLWYDRKRSAYVIKGYHSCLFMCKNGIGGEWTSKTWGKEIWKKAGKFLDPEEPQPNMQVKRYRHPLEKKVEKLNENLRSTQDEMNTVKLSLSRKEDELNQARESLKKTKDEVAEKTAELRKALDKAETCREELISARDDMKKKDNELHETKENLDAKKDEVAKLRKRLDEAGIWREELISAQDDIKKKDNELHEAKENLDAKKDEVAELRKRLDEAGTWREELISARDDMKKKDNELHEAKENLTATKNDLVAATVLLAEKKGEMQRMQEKEDALIDKLFTEAVRHEKELETEMKNFHSQLKTSRDENQQLSRKNQELQDLQKKLNGLRQTDVLQIEALKEKIKEKKKEISELKNKHEVLQKKICEVVTCIGDKTGRLVDQVRGLQAHMDKAAGKFKDAVITHVDEAAEKINKHVDKVADDIKCTVAGEIKQAINFDDVTGSMKEKYAEFLGIIAETQVDISELKLTAQGQSQALERFGKQLLPVPSHITVEEGFFRDEAKLEFICKRSDGTRSYSVHAASKWIKWAAIGCSLVKGVVNVSVGRFSKAMNNAEDLKTLVDNLDDSLRTKLVSFEKGSVGVLSSKDHDMMLKQLKRRHFFEEWEFCEYNKEFGWYMIAQETLQVKDSCCNGCVIS